MHISAKLWRAWDSAGARIGGRPAEFSLRPLKEDVLSDADLNETAARDPEQPDAVQQFSVARRMGAPVKQASLQLPAENQTRLCRWS